MCWIYRPNPNQNSTWDVGYYNMAGAFIVIRNVKLETRAMFIVHYLNGGVDEPDSGID